MIKTLAASIFLLLCTILVGCYPGYRQGYGPGYVAPVYFTPYESNYPYIYYEPRRFYGRHGNYGGLRFPEKY